MTSRTVNFLTIAILLFVIYFLQGFLYPTGSIISQFSILLFLIIGFFSFIKTLLRLNNPFFVKVFIAFYIILLLTFLLSPKTVIGTKNEAIGLVSTFGQFKEISAFVLSFFIAYIFVSKNNINSTYIYWTGIVFFVLSVIRYFFSKDLLLEDREMFTNNAGYFLVAIIPYIPFLIEKKKSIGVIISVLVTGLIIASAKRGAIVCLIASILFMLLYYLKSHKITIKHIIVTLIVFSISAIFVYYAVTSNEYLMMRIVKTQDEGIGQRSIAYLTLWQYWSSETNILKFLFGNGMTQTVTVWGNYAHNDWLELLIDNGLVGVILYMLFFISAFAYIRKMKIESIYKLSAYLCLIIWLLKTIFSMGYTSIMNVIFCLLLGMIIGINELKKRSNI